LAYTFVVDSMGLSSFKFVQYGLQKTHLFCNGAFWPFKVIQGQWFWYQSRARMQLPISRSLRLWSYLAPILRYGDFLARNCLFLLPLSHSAPPLLMFPFEFCGQAVKKLESWGYPVVKTPWL